MKYLYSNSIIAIIRSRKQKQFGRLKEIVISVKASTYKTVKEEMYRGKNVYI